MAKRIKPVIALERITSLEEADSALARIAALDRYLDLIKTSLNDDIDALKLKAEAEAEPLRRDKEALGQALAVFAEANKNALFKDNKSISLQFGVIGYRLTTKIKTLRKWTFERVLDTLQGLGLDRYIRVKHEVNKEALRGATPELLAQVGCCLEAKDDFFYEVAEQSLASVPLAPAESASSGEAA